MDIHAQTCSCPACIGRSPDALRDAGATSDAVSSGPKPVLALADVVHQLTTQWGDNYEGTTRTWHSTGLTYAMPDISPVGTEASGFKAMTPAMKAAAREAFELWDDLIAIRLDESTSNAANITFAYSSNTGGSTYARTWISGSSGTDFAISKSQLWFADNWHTHDQDSDVYHGGYGVMTYLHEIGHALGLSHPGTYNAGQGAPTYATSAEYAQDTRQYTAMSYWDADEGNPLVDHWGSGGRWTYAATPLLHDIAAAQAKYGADMTTRTGDTVYGFNANAGRDAFDFARNPDPVIAIWDAGGRDTLDASGYATHQTIDLTPGSISSIGYLTHNVAIAYGAWIEDARGGSGNDVIIGNALDNLVIGNDGNDFFLASAGNDIVQGGNGHDLVRYALSSASYGFMTHGDTTLVGQAGFGLHRIYEVETFQFAGAQLGAVRSPLEYAAGYGDLIDAFGADRGAAFRHFSDHGWHEGRTVTFDALEYVASYTDLIAAFGADRDAGARHFMAHGIQEGRQTFFDALSYIASYGDLIAAFGANPDAGARHFIQYGLSEGRTQRFDPVSYVKNYSDLQQAFGTDYEAATLHYVNYGHLEGRSWEGDLMA
jgi:hypothetical protein